MEFQMKFAKKFHYNPGKGGKGGKRSVRLEKIGSFFEMMDRQVFEIMKPVGKLQEMHWFCLRREEQNGPLLDQHRN